MMCTWLTSDEFKKYETVDDDYLNELLKEVRDISGNKYFMRKRTIETKKLFRKVKKSEYYELYVALQGTEVQVINFCQDHEWSINSVVTKSYMVTFLLGILSGHHMTKEKQQKINP